MQEARLGPDDLGQVGEKGDDVVLDLALDLSAACASISNQMR